MGTKYASFIRSIRQGRRFSQSFVAEKLGLSRPSYAAIERGTRSLSLAEAEKLSALFGMSLGELSRTATPNYEKYKQMILAFLRIAKPGDGRIPKTKLAKLLYLADFAWYYDHLESMSNMEYRRRVYGPVPDPYFRALDELEAEGKINEVRKGDAILVSLGGGAKQQKLDLLKKDELDLVGRISTKWIGRRSQEIVSFTHDQLPYKLCAPDEAIPYELITQEDPEHVY